MHTTKILILLTLHAVCLAGIARADTLRVEQNGSGDFTIIQEAVDAAAHGDTILIGRGIIRTHMTTIRRVDRSSRWWPPG